MEELLQGMRAIAEPTRIRILVLCAHSELTVSELVQILGQSQPRVSRHLRLMVEAGVLQRHQEGTWAWYRLANKLAPIAGGGRAANRVAQMAADLIDLIPEEDPVVSRDLERLEGIRQERARIAEEYFTRNAEDWGRIRALHVDEGQVNDAVQAAFAKAPVQRLLDIGTGTGSVLRLLGDHIQSGTGVDQSPQMLSIARSALDRAQLTHCQVRQADMYQLPYDAGSFDAACLHMVLHYAEEPAVALREAARVLEAGGRLVVVDFAPHNVAELHSRHAHRWPGFSDDQVVGWMLDAGLENPEIKHMEGGPLTVTLWEATQSVEARNAKKGAI
ncbi:ArsR family transcriptional regulator [Aestuariispira insulae]|uniref:ArsR family transcriptional regulator n=2 Tax=Aestuariispira insulae TaxID=1461337 RepID=A0A3D9HRZ2_9PROT|nr:ArsR family transcriptional regulator [Aestuariispira insulae]